MAISYPVPEDSRWATWSISEAVIRKHNSKWPRTDGGPIVDQNPDIVGLLEVQLDIPAYDQATHKLVANVTVDVPANQHIHGYDIVALTQEELDEIAADEEWTQEQITAKAQYDDLQNGVGTSAERVERTEKVCAHLLKVVYDI
jgi:hypothetical protein